jgi:hypothetical protein
VACCFSFIHTLSGPGGAVIGVMWYPGVVEKDYAGELAII